MKEKVCTRCASLKSLKDFTPIKRGISDAHKQTGVSPSGISSVCRGEGKTAGGFIWKKETEICVD